MRKVRRLFLLVCVLFISVSVLAPNLSNEVKEKMIWNHMVAQNKLRVQKMRTKELNRYLEAIGHSESRGNPEAYNRYGYIGKYQFGYAARKYFVDQQMRYARLTNRRLTRREAFEMWVHYNGELTDISDFWKKVQKKYGAIHRKYSG